jgi:O-antigen/teichoic acid export membrane protein
MALLFTRFMRSISQVGFGNALIQNRDATEGQVSAVFLMQCGINLGMALAGLAAAPLAAGFFKEPRLIPIINVLAWLQFIDSFAFPQILLQRALKFSRYSFLEIITMLVANCIGIVLALRGYGVWSLVAILVIQRLLFVVAIWPLAGWLPSRPTFAGVGKMVRFGINMQVSNICHYFSQNMVGIITGRYLGVETLGSLNIATNLAIVPAQKIQSILTSVLAPAFATVQADVAQLRDVFRRSLFSLAVVYVPIMFGLSAVAVNLVLVVYGDKWRDAGVFLAFLSVVGLCKGFEHLMRSVIISRGWGASAIARITFVETIVGVPLLFAGTHFFGIMGLIAAYLAGAVLACILSTRGAEQAVEERGLFVSVVIRTFAVAAVMYAMVTVMNLALALPPSVALPLQVAAGMLVYGVIRIRTLTAQERDVVQAWPMVARLLPALR